MKVNEFKIRRPDIILLMISTIDNVGDKKQKTRHDKSLVKISGEFKLRQKWMAIDAVNRKLVIWN